MVRHFGRRAGLLLGLCVAVIVGISIAAVVHQRGARRAQLAADIHRLESWVPKYAIETTKLGLTSEDATWQAYCEHERVTLIEEARASAAQ